MFQKGLRLPQLSGAGSKRGGTMLGLCILRAGRCLRSACERQDALPHPLRWRSDIGQRGRCRRRRGGGYSLLEGGVAPAPCGTSWPGRRPWRAAAQRHPSACSPRPLRARPRAHTSAAPLPARCGCPLPARCGCNPSPPAATATPLRPLRLPPLPARCGCRLIFIPGSPRCTPTQSRKRLRGAGSTRCRCRPSRQRKTGGSVACPTECTPHDVPVQGLWGRSPECVAPRGADHSAPLHIPDDWSGQLPGSEG
eukprot:gene19390-biopygen2500